jgi:hypothetical protein
MATLNVQATGESQSCGRRCKDDIGKNRAKRTNIHANSMP